MKIYLSLPISGHDIEKRKKVAEHLKKNIEGAHPHTQVITPFEICTEEDKPYSYYMGRCIEVLIDCDTIFLAPGWRNSKGCNAEYAVANIYGLNVMTTW